MYVFLLFCDKNTPLKRYIDTNNFVIHALLKQNPKLIMDSCHSCIFCDIIGGRSPGQIYFEDEQTLVLKDSRPVNEFHYLAIPKKHIASEEDLVPKHTKLIKRLIRNGKRVMSQMGADMDDLLYGFHRAPFLTVHHLHMHFISPRRNLRFDEHLYQFNTRYFISAIDVLVRLGEKRIRRVTATAAAEVEEEEQINCCVII